MGRDAAHAFDSSFEGSKLTIFFKVASSLVVKRLGALLLLFQVSKLLKKFSMLKDPVALENFLMFPLSMMLHPI